MTLKVLEGIKTGDRNQSLSNCNVHTYHILRNLLNTSSHSRSVSSDLPACVSSKLPGDANLWTSLQQTGFKAGVLRMRSCG